MMIHMSGEAHKFVERGMWMIRFWLHVTTHASVETRLVPEAASQRASG